MPTSKVSVSGLRYYIQVCLSDKQYEKYPILDEYPTRRKALNFLQELEEKGVVWLE